MAYKAKSGKSFSNRHMATRDDVLHEQPKTAMKINPLGDKSDNTEALGKVSANHDSAEPEESQDPSQVVEQHGPATEVSVKHEGDKHTVTSKHSDGHVHKSEHASASEAHDAASQLSAGEGDTPEDNEDGATPQVPAGLMGQ